jgi:DDE family transposase
MGLRHGGLPRYGRGGRGPALVKETALSPQPATPTYPFATATALAREAACEGGRLTSEGGLPWRAAAAAAAELGICAAVAARVPEWRRGPVRPARAALVRPRVSHIACGYEEQHDADSLRAAPLLTLVCGRRPARAPDLARPPTIARLARRANAVERRAGGRRAPAPRDVSRPAREQDGRPPHLVIARARTDDPPHGAQEGTA